MTDTDSLHGDQGDGIGAGDRQVVNQTEAVLPRGADRAGPGVTTIGNGALPAT